MYKKLHRLSLDYGKKKGFLGKEKRRVNTVEATRPLRLSLATLLSPLP
jgi:hypothetical protein